MKWSEFFTSSVGKKFVMALTGLFLISFLIVHGGINACIFADVLDDNDNGEIFNIAAHFMGAYYVIRILEVGLFAGFILHIVQGFILAAQNNARRKIGYKVPMGSEGSAWYKKSMGILGTLIFLFLIMHVSHFWVPSRITHTLDEVYYNNSTVPMHNLYARMIETFQEWWIVALYVIGCISLAWHLLHGFQSAFRTVGVHNKKWLGVAKATGAAFAIIVPLIFALMPISMYFGWVDMN
jgi:succinate dehydrogenase / fumarate reductase, cytochrome b subunit